MFRFIVVGLAMAGAIVAIVWSTYTSIPKGLPLLNGPAQVTLLSLITVLALYLRQVNLNIIDMRYKIWHREIWYKDPEKKYAAAKAQRLQETSDIIMLVSPFLLTLMVVISARMVYDAFLRFDYTADQPSPKFLYVLDYIIAVWSALSIVGLTFAHVMVRRKDRHIDKELKDYYAAHPIHDDITPDTVPATEM